MTPKAFRAWLAAMQAAGHAKTETECAQMLGYRAATLPKQRGGDQRLALACAALLAGLEPFEG